MSSPQLAALDDDVTADALLQVLRAVTVEHLSAHYEWAAGRPAPTGTTEFQRLTEADANVWRCRCGAWRYGSRDCGVCPRIVEVAA